MRHPGHLVRNTSSHGALNADPPKDASSRDVCCPTALCDDLHNNESTWFFSFLFIYLIHMSLCLYVKTASNVHTYARTHLRYTLNLTSRGGCPTVLMPLKW